MLERVRVLVVVDEEGREILKRGKGKLWASSCVRKAMERRQMVVFEDIPTNGGPDTAVRLLLKTVVVIPMKFKGRLYYLYADSGTEVRFTSEDIWQLVGMAKYVISEKEKEKEKELRVAFVGRSAAAEEVRQRIKKASAGDFPVFIEGETGVGKSIAARLLHELSSRKGKFVVVNCASLPEALFEAEVFGYREGAFTDARKDKPGLVEEAEGGTLFLDEITEMPLSAQAKLLDFVERRKYRRVGDTEEREANVRLISASNRSVEEAIASGKFRQDLYHRLSAYRIKIPPLRQRPQDIEDLVEHYRAFLRGRSLGKEALSYLKAHPLPGNVRQLINVLMTLGIEGEVEVRIEEMRKVLPLWEFQRREVLVEKLWDEIEEGGNFWDVVWRRFISRELNRSQVKEFLRHGLVLSGESWKKLCERMRIGEDYHKFMSLLKKYALKINL